MAGRTLTFGLCLVAGAATAFGQTSREDLRSGDPRAFDTMDPSSYQLDFPLLPPEEPLNDFDQSPPFPVDTRSDPQALFDDISRTGLPTPPQTPADYNPESIFLQTRFANEAALQAGVDYPIATDREVVLLDAGHPVYFSLSKTAALFMIEESSVSKVMPAIPDPSLIFEKQRPYLRTLGLFRYMVDVGHTFAFANNVFGTQKDHLSDVYFALNPRIYVETGNRGLLSLSYSPSFVRYHKYKEMNAGNENTTLALRYPFSKLEVGSDLSYQTQSGLFINSPGVAQQRTWLSNTFLRYPITHKTEATLGYRVTFNDRSPGGRRTDHLLSGYLDHTYSPKWTFGSYLEVGRSNAPEWEQAYGTAGVRLQYRPDYHWRFILQAGQHQREISPALPTLGELQTPVFKFTAAYHRTANLGVVLRAFREVTTDGFAEVALSLRTGAELTFLSRFYRKAELSLRVGVGQMELWSSMEPYESDLGYLEGALALSYELSRNVEVILFDNLQRRFAASHSNRYTANTVGLAINLRF